MLSVIVIVIAGSVAGAGAQLPEVDLPHVDDCYLCQTCWHDRNKDPNTPPPLPLEAEPADQGQQGASRIVPDWDTLQAKKLKPNCTECWGCTTQLQPLAAVQAFGHKFAVETGASSEWLFFADLPNGHPMGAKALVKVWCLPIDKVRGGFTQECVPGHGTDIAVRGAAHLVALDKVTADCGLHDVVIKVWLAPVNAVVPGIGYHIWWYGLWMERAPGLSLNQLAYINKRALIDRLIMGLMQEQMNRTQVVRSAIFDLLTSQCDRHSQNVFIDETGNLKLIDNLNSLRLVWEHCAVDSLLLPGTQKNEIIRWGGPLIMKRPGAPPRKTMNPLILMDYRCDVPEGELGTELPRDVTQCCRKLAGMTAEQVQEQYGFTHRAPAEVLLSRATDLVTKGFEWTLKKGSPRNSPPQRYKWYPPCCRLSFDKQGLQCEHEWSPVPEFPLGDPVRGGEWHGKGPDTGTYNGSTLWDELPE